MYRDASFKRPSYPNEQQSNSIAAALSLLSKMMDRDPELYRIQNDQEAVLALPTIQAMAKDFLNAPIGKRQIENTFFYAEEKATLTTALEYMANFQAAVGKEETAAELHAFMGDKANNILSPRKMMAFADEIHGAMDFDALKSHSIVNEKATRKTKNPHEGLTLDEKEVEWLTATSPAPS